MHLNVQQRGDHVATFRWIDVRLMETLAAWVPTTAEMEVKLLFGAHVYDVAQHADALGRRTRELRLPEQYSIPPVPDYAACIDGIGATTDTAKRVAGFYDCALIDLDRRLGAYVEQVDTLLDAPTIRIIDRIRADMRRMTQECTDLRGEIAAARLGDPAWLAAAEQRFASVTDIVGAPAERDALATAG